jgi:membrane protein DedA with SNARE-associated domain
MNLAAELGHLLHTYGYGAVLVIPMLESAGLPLPGETMLLTASVYAATTGRLNIVGVIVAAAAGAIIGDNLGYLVGREAGRAVVLRYGRWVRLDEHKLKLGERFFARHGSKTVFLARFVAGLRTVGALLAGVSRMMYRRFLLYNAAGGVTWAAAYGTLAYLLGRNFDRYRSLFERLGLLLGAVAVVAIGALFLGRKRFEHWAVGPDPDEGRAL